MHPIQIYNSFESVPKVALETSETEFIDKYFNNMKIIRDFVEMNSRMIESEMFTYMEFEPAFTRWSELLTCIEYSGANINKHFIVDNKILIGGIYDTRPFIFTCELDRITNSAMVPFFDIDDGFASPIEGQMTEFVKGVNSKFNAWKERGCSGMILE